MKASLHPTWYENATVTCACGNSFTVGSTQESIHVEVCYNCHPFYTGQMKYLDTAGRVDAFKARMKSKQDKVLSKDQRRTIKRQKRLEKELQRPDTLEELRKKVK